LRERRSKEYGGEAGIGVRRRMAKGPPRDAGGTRAGGDEMAAVDARGCEREEGAGGDEMATVLVGMAAQATVTRRLRERQTKR
jgi:hypothetical protein